MAERKSTLKADELAALRSRAKIVSPVEIGDRVVERDGRTVFRAIRKTPRAAAGHLDIQGDEPPSRDEYEVVEITLINAEDFDYTPKLTSADKKAAAPIDAKLAPMKAYYAYDAGLLSPAAPAGEGEGDASLPSVVDHRPLQSPVKNQAGRGTCVSHAAMGLLEAFPHIDDNLSEQYTHFKFNQFLKRPHNEDAGLTTTDAAPFLARQDGRVCLESEWPYIPNQTTINNAVAAGTYAPPASATNNQRFGIGAYKIIGDNGLTGESIKNTRYLEALLYQGYNVVIGVWASWDDKDNDGVLSPLLNSNGTPASNGGHAMVIVGYDRDKQYFIFKNSWAPTWGHSGYGYFHYDFVRACAKYGFVVDSVVPAVPPAGAPPKLVNAPYNATRISRGDLRAAVVFFKTSSGRYAVAEAYAGDNLMLRNLRVYNPNGTTHLTRDNLIIRSSFLCDLDTGAETANNADFWWHGVSPGVHYLEPRNGASAWLAYNLAALTAAQISAMSLSTSSIDKAQLRYCVVAGRTAEGRVFKVLAHAKSGNVLQLSYVEVFNADGSRFKYGQSINVPSSWTFNLDTLSQGGGSSADIWWNVVSDNVGFLKPNGTGRIRYLWSL